MSGTVDANLRTTKRTESFPFVIDDLQSPTAGMQFSGPRGHAVTSVMPCALGAWQAPCDKGKGAAGIG